jgi:hypothetical protein
VTLKPGDLGVDYSYARPSLAGLAQSGARFVLRYSAGAASDPGHPSHSANAGKLISPAEFKDILDASLDVIANDEWYASRISEGKAAGRADALAAARLWKACGLAKGSTIYVSWDTDPSLSKFASVGRYARAYRKALGGYYEAGVYGGTGFLKWAFKQALIRFGWRPNAGSWSNDGLPYQPDTSTASKREALVKLALSKTPAHIWQTGNYWVGKSADEDLILRVPVGSHLEALASLNPVPAPKPPIPDPINSEELALSPDDKKYLDAKFAELDAQLRGLFTGNDNKPHRLATFLKKALGKQVDFTKP